MIKAPYNFVPLNKTVVTPYWSNYVSHDVPFENSESGEFEVIITAKTPLFIKDGLSAAEEKNYYNDKKEQIKPFSFCKDSSGHFFIPGSSVKGMIRNVLEIMSFGYMGRKINDTRFSVRDFGNNDLYNPSELSKEVQCGWLFKSGEKFKLEEAGAVKRIGHDEIENYFQINGFANNGNNKSAKVKFDKFISLGFEVNPKIKLREFFDGKGKIKYNIDNTGEKEGRIVVTGQPSDLKTKEFIFFESGRTRNVSNEVIKNFFFAYYNHDFAQQSDDWIFWEKKLRSGEKIPIFYRKDGGQVKDMGLAMLYKIVYKNSVLESINYHQKNRSLDLSETIFGHIEGVNSLKGRVHFSHAPLQNEVTECNPRSEVLSSPKGSYYPNYVRQNGESKYQTFNNHDAEISGWKRYPVHSNRVTRNPRPKNSSPKILTHFIPINSGAIFKLKIRYHNLKKIELGALLSAITFHETDGAFHSIGMAKPLGYGKVKLEINGLENTSSLMREFEDFMNLELDLDKPKWHQSEQILELMAMSFEQQNKGASALEYMNLETRGRNEFQEAKNNNEYLKRYSELTEFESLIQPLSSELSIKNAKGVKNQENEMLAKLENVVELIERRKHELKVQLGNSLEEIKVEYQEKISKLLKIVNQKKSQDKGLYPEIKELNFKAPKVYDKLKKIVDAYCRAHHQMNDKQLKNNFPNGYLPEDDVDDLLNAIQMLIENASNSELKQWKKPFDKNGRLKKVTDWIGEELARKIEVG